MLLVGGVTSLNEIWEVDEVGGKELQNMEKGFNPKRQKFIKKDDKNGIDLSKNIKLYEWGYTQQRD